MAWITASDGDLYVGSASAPTGYCHAVDPNNGSTACGAGTSTLQLFFEVPFSRARMAGGEVCPSCVARTEEEHATV
jgi:hypothetical protein